MRVVTKEGKGERKERDTHIVYRRGEWKKGKDNGRPVTAWGRGHCIAKHAQSSMIARLLRNGKQSKRLKKEAKILSRDKSNQQLLNTKTTTTTIYLNLRNT